MSQQSKEAFEARMRKASTSDLTINRFGNYRSSYVQNKWNEFKAGWQAALASQAQQPDWLLKSTQDLATHLWQKHYKSESPVFEVLNDLAGVISQIDNMTTGLVRLQSQAQQPTELSKQLREYAAAWVEAAPEEEKP